MNIPNDEQNDNDYQNNDDNNQQDNKTESLGLGLIANDIKLHSEKKSEYSDAFNSKSTSIRSISTVSEESDNENEYEDNENKYYYERENDDDKIRKIELLRIFTELKRQGYVISQDYNMKSSLTTMEQEYEILKSSKMKNQALKLSQGFLINAVQTLEFLNTKFDPIGVDLIGFSEVVSLGIDDYNEVLDELYEKYKKYGRKVEPEIKLILMLGGSAASFHASKTLLKNVPGMQNLEKNPKFVNKLGKQFAESMSKPQQPPVPEDIVIEHNIDKHKEFMSKMRNKSVRKKNNINQDTQINIDI